jgi:hypothetical protein
LERGSQIQVVKKTPDPGSETLLCCLCCLCEIITCCDI